MRLVFAFLYPIAVFLSSTVTLNIHTLVEGGEHEQRLLTQKTAFFCAQRKEKGAFRRHKTIIKKKKAHQKVSLSPRRLRIKQKKKKKTTKKRRRERYKEASFCLFCSCVSPKKRCAGSRRSTCVGDDGKSSPWTRVERFLLDIVLWDCFERASALF